MFTSFIGVIFLNFWNSFDFSWIISWSIKTLATLRTRSLLTARTDVRLWSSGCRFHFNGRIGCSLFLTYNNNNLRIFYSLVIDNRINDIDRKTLSLVFCVVIIAEKKLTYQLTRNIYILAVLLAVPFVKKKKNKKKIRPRRGLEHLFFM